MFLETAEDGWEEFEIDQDSLKDHVDMDHGFDEFDEDNLLDMIHPKKESSDYLSSGPAITEPEMIKSGGHKFALLDWNIGDIPESTDPEAS